MFDIQDRMTWNTIRSAGDILPRPSLRLHAAKRRNALRDGDNRNTIDRIIPALFLIRSRLHWLTTTADIMEVWAQSTPKMGVSLANNQRARRLTNRRLPAICETETLRLDWAPQIMLYSIVAFYNKDRSSR